jgi:putative phage-type endonuclease
VRELASLTDLSHEHWLELRRTSGIGSSDAAAVLGLSPWKSPLALFAEKTGLTEEDDNLDEKEYIEWGTALEPLIADKYQKVTGRQLSRPTAIYRHEAYDWMIGSPDRFIQDDRGLGILEIKTVGSFHAKEWMEEPPLFYQVQLQHLLCVIGAKFGSFAVLIGGQKFAWCDAERNERFCSYLIEKEAIFWDGVIRGIAPEADASDSTREVLRRMYPKDSGDSIALPPDAIAWDEQLQFAKAEIKAAKAREQEAENKIKAAIGNASIGVLPGSGAYSWKAGPRAGYTIAPGIVRTLRRIKA